MAKKLIQKYFSGKSHYYKNSRLSQVFGKVLHRQYLWYINRRSVSVAFGVGLFCAFIPVPLQMLFAAVAAILLRANLPVAVASVWITNPLTITPIYFFCYKVGQWLTIFLGNVPYLKTNVVLPNADFSSAWQFLLLGCLVVGSFTAILGYSTVNVAWRYYTGINWRYRKSANNRQR